MHIICMTPIAEGVFNDHKADHITAPPEGWAYIPEDFVLPSTFPRLGSIGAEEINGIMTVTNMTEGTLPDPVPEDDTPTNEERIAALEEQLVESDEAAIALYEAQAQQEAINAEQDEAILGIYEMIGG